jgi:hypothetical protein
MDGQLRAADLKDATCGKAESRPCFSSRGNFSIIEMTAIILDLTGTVKNLQKGESERWQIGTYTSKIKPSFS